MTHLEANYVTVLLPSLVFASSIITSIFYITTYFLIKKFQMSTTQNLRNKFTTIINNKILTITLTSIALFVSILFMINLALGFSYILTSIHVVGIFADVLLIYFLVSNEEAMKHMKRKFKAWKEENSINFETKKINPMVDAVVEIPIPIPVPFNGSDLVVIDLE